MTMLKIVPALAALLATTAHAEPVTKTVTHDGPKYAAERTTMRDKETGLYTRDAEATRKADGATASRTYERQRTETGYTVSGSGTNFAGKTRSFDVERTRTDSGFTASGSYTGRGGEDYALSANRTRTDNGYTANRNVTNSAGESLYNRDVVQTRADGQISRSVNVTRAEGFKLPKPARHARGRRGN